MAEDEGQFESEENTGGAAEDGDNATDGKDSKVTAGGNIEGDEATTRGAIEDDSGVIVIRKRFNIKASEKTKKIAMEKILEKLDETDSFYRSDLSEINETIIDQMQVLDQLTDEVNQLRGVLSQRWNYVGQQVSLVTVQVPMPIWKRTIDTQYRRIRQRKVLVKDYMKLRASQGNLPEDKIVAATVADLVQLSKAVANQLKTKFSVFNNTTWGKL
ncbi:hypothetical protein DFQ30_005763 [Apophysomyces sp. BC1015]|nr:hypothetical protein DFQ30_005763 [Apophysomyces sp. BC1015]